ncbi:DUF4136 domain-containing protein [Moheibacter sediminis]|uniref:DUF4136 domain-containing protein n=1 Tax=Moheibacter sediminis TaxID=1434700 RepID=A0A1W1YI58_9FLAO|nr:DUF4136 domain-containing protein [Moheibacter sediminis]SMC35814.1 protein of unknown function [Moheibacter sediminis]
MKKFILLSFSILLLAACSTQTVTVDYDRSQDFSQIKNYSVELTSGSLGELDEARLKQSLNQELAAKGLNESGNPDVIINVVPEEFISENQSSSVGVGMGGGSGGFGTSVGFGIPINSEKLNQNYKVTMTTTEGNLVWEGRLDIQMPVNASPEMREANIQKGVSKLFKKYPPK